MSALRECPFCGQPPETIEAGEGGRGLMIECMTNGCVNPHVSYYDHATSRRLWNARSPDAARAAAEDMRERAAEVCDEYHRALEGYPAGRAAKTLAEDIRALPSDPAQNEEGE